MIHNSVPDRQLLNNPGNFRLFFAVTGGVTAIEIIHSSPYGSMARVGRWLAVARGPLLCCAFSTSEEVGGRNCGRIKTGMGFA
jgi:hypothetical protein